MGNGFGTQTGTLTISFGTHYTITTTIASESGTFNVTFIVDTQPAGTTVITAWGSYDTDTFYIQGKVTLASPSSGSVGSIVTIEGTGYNEGEYVYISFGTAQNVTSYKVGQNGTFSVTFMINTQPGGTTIITAYDLSELSTGEFCIIPTIIGIVPKSGQEGTNVI